LGVNISRGERLLTRGLFTRKSLPRSGTTYLPPLLSSNRILCARFIRGEGVESRQVRKGQCKALLRRKPGAGQKG